MPAVVRRFRAATFAGGLVASLVIPGVALGGQQPAPKELEAMYVEGSDKFEEGDFTGAAEAWTRLLDTLPESPANLATRENVLLNIIEAHLSAYHRQLGAQGKDIAHLYAGKAVVDRYVEQFRAAYGPERAISAAVQEKIANLEDETIRAEDPIEPCLSPPPCLSPCLQPCLSPLPPEPRRGCGSTNDPVQAVMLGLLGLPLVRRRRRDVLADLSSRLPADVVQRLQARLREEDDAD